MGRIFDIKKFSVNDGPGIRTTIFLKGCSLNCKWCHNPEGKSYKNNFIIEKDLCIDNCYNCEKICGEKYGKDKILGNQIINNNGCKFCNLCSENCPAGAIKVYGREISKEDILNIAIEQHELYRISNGGITFSGGEVFCQFEFLIDSCRLIKDKFQDVNIAIETSLDTKLENIIELSKYVDLFIVDFKCLQQKMSEQYVGLDVNKFLLNFSRLVQLNKKIWIRMVLIKDITFCQENINIFNNYLTSIKLTNIEKIQLLEYHSMALPKYDELNMDKHEFNGVTKSDSNKVIDELKKILNKDITIEYLTI